jgi:hypothetical protein
MAPRTRTETNTRPKGTRTRFGTTEGAGQMAWWAQRTCSDQIGPGDNAPLTVSKWEMSGGIINNDFYSYFGGWFQNYFADGMSEANFPHLDVWSGGISNPEAATMAAARTSPSSAYVDAIANVLEIADIAQLIKNTGETLLKKAARSNLKVQFGMLPLVRDLDKLIAFQNQAMRRVQVIKKLRDTGSYRKTVDIGVYNGVANDFLVLQSADAFIRVARTIETVHGIRAHCRWKPSVDLSHMDNQAMHALARAAVVNLRVDYSALWEAMPWSWLIDWCGNVGTYLKSQRNIVPASLDSVTVMRHTKTKHRTDGYSDPSSGNRTMTPAFVTRETKSRATSFVSLTAHWPFLSANQMGILASLSVR